MASLCGVTVLNRVSISVTSVVVVDVVVVGVIVVLVSGVIPEFRQTTKRYICLDSLFITSTSVPDNDFRARNLTYRARARARVCVIA